MVTLRKYHSVIPGLSVKFKDEKRKAFADRHNCSTKKDRTKAGYWSCNLPRMQSNLEWVTIKIPIGNETW